MGTGIKTLYATNGKPVAKVSRLLRVRGRFNGKKTVVEVRRKVNAEESLEIAEPASKKKSQTKEEEKRTTQPNILRRGADGKPPTAIGTTLGPAIACRNKKKKGEERGTRQTA